MGLNLAGFFSRNLDFDTFKLAYNYNNVIGDSVSASDRRGILFILNLKGEGMRCFGLTN